MASQLGTKIIDFFQDPGRGINSGKNDHGVEVDFLLVSVEEEAFRDSQVASLAQNNGFEGAAIDLAPNRIDAIRAGFSHYRGVASTPEPSSLPFADRRRIVILNVVNGSPGPEFLEILHNDIPEPSGALSLDDENAIKNAINSVQAGPADSDGDGLTDDEELNLTGTNPSLADSDGNGTSDADEDPDHDGFTNLAEVRLTLTDPLDGASLFTVQLSAASDPHSLSIPTLTGRRYTIETRTLPGPWAPHSEVSGTGNTVDVPLGPSDSNPRFYQVHIAFEP